MTNTTKAPPAETPRYITVRIGTKFHVAQRAAGMDRTFFSVAVASGEMSAHRIMAALADADATPAAPVVPVEPRTRLLRKAAR